MALRRRPPLDEKPDGILMTPMIDVVFQLIIFFMLGSEFIQVTLEKVRPPSATELLKAS
jgi:biopolymer transport protein ExbD